MDSNGDLRWGASGAGANITGEVILTSTNLDTRISDDTLSISKINGLYTDVTGALRWGGLSGEVILTSTNLNTRIHDDILSISKINGLQTVLDTIPTTDGFDVSVGNVTQTFTRLDFLNRTFDLTNGVLTIGPFSKYMTLPMTYDGVH